MGSYMSIDSATLFVKALFMEFYLESDLELTIKEMPKMTTNGAECWESM